MILKFVRERKEQLEFEEFVYSDVKSYHKYSNNRDNKFNSSLSVRFLDGEEINLILTDDNRDVYHAIYVMNDKGQTIERII